MKLDIIKNLKNSWIYLFWIILSIFGYIFYNNTNHQDEKFVTETIARLNQANKSQLILEREKLIIEISNLYKRALQNDSEAMFKLGEIYCNRENYPATNICQDYGLEWIRSAAKLGYSDAQLTLADKLNSALFGKVSIDIEPNNKEALFWYKQVATRNDPSSSEIYLGGVSNASIASMWLGILYSDGAGIEKDLNESFRWHLKAAKLGHPSSIYHVAEMYREGKGTKTNIDESIYWFKKIASCKTNFCPKSLDAKHILAQLYYLNKEDYASAIKIFQEIYNESSNDDYYRMVAASYLGLIYYFGLSVNKDYQKASNYIEQSANYGISRSQSIYAYMYFNGLGALQDYKKAFAWASLAASNGEERAVQIRNASKNNLSNKDLDEARLLAEQLKDKITERSSKD